MGIFSIVASNENNRLFPKKVELIAIKTNLFLFESIGIVD